MKQVVYVDVLLLTNLFINVLLLLVSGVLLRRRIKRIRLFFAAAFGSLLSLSIFLPQQQLVVSLAMKMLGAAIITYIAFPHKPAKIFFRAYGCFLLSNFLFAGLMLAIWLAFSPGGMVVNNGAVYFDISVLVLTVSALLCYGIISLVLFLTRHNAPQNHLCEIAITHQGKQAAGKALFDSGNALREGFSGKPVIIVDPLFIQPLIPQELSGLLGKNCYDADTYMPLQSTVRFVPYRSIRGDGILPAFPADFVCVRNGAKQYTASGVYLAVSDTGVSAGEYVALVGSAFFESYDERESSIERNTSAHFQLGARKKMEARRK